MSGRFWNGRASEADAASLLGPSLCFGGTRRARREWAGGAARVGHGIRASSADEARLGFIVWTRRQQLSNSRGAAGVRTWCMIRRRKKSRERTKRIVLALTSSVPVSHRRHTGAGDQPLPILRGNSSGPCRHETSGVRASRQRHDDMCHDACQCAHAVGASLGLAGLQFEPRTSRDPAPGTGRVTRTRLRSWLLPTRRPSLLPGASPLGEMPPCTRPSICTY